MTSEFERRTGLTELMYGVSAVQIRGAEEAMNFPIISDSMIIQSAYEDMRMMGESHNIAEMLALRQCPMSNTDREFLQGRGGCYDQFNGNEELGAYYRRVAEAHGQNPTGKVYLSSLAAFPGDPRAWVTGRGDVQDVCEQRGWGCEGAVNRPVTKVAELSGGGIASDVVDGLVAERLEQNPSARPADVREAVIEQHAPHWAKREVQ